MKRILFVFALFFQIVCFGEGVLESGMQFFDDVRGDTPIVTNAWENVSNKVHSLIQVVSPKTDISGKQDILPYPTNAIPYDVLKDVPENDLITDGTNIVYSSLEVFRQSDGWSDWTVEWYIAAPSVYQISYSNVSGLQDEWVLDLLDGGMPYLSGVTDTNATEVVFRGIARIKRMHDGWNYMGKLATTNDVAHMISGKADEVIEKWTVIEESNVTFIGQPTFDDANAEWYWNDSSGKTWFAVGGLDSTTAIFYDGFGGELNASRYLRVLRAGDAENIAQLASKQDILPYPTNNIPVSAVNGAVTDSQIISINHRIDTIEMSSRPNINVVGSPIFSQGNVSGFTANDYLVFPSNVSVGTNTVEFYMGFTTGSDVTTKQNILDSAYGLAFAISNRYTITSISYDGNTFVNARSSANSVSANTSYWLKLVFRKSGGNYFTETYLGTSKANMTQRGSAIQTGVPLVAKPTYWGGANPITGVNNLFKGTINLNECSLEFNGREVWTGYDTVQNDYVSFNPNDENPLNTADKIVEEAGKSANKSFNDWRTNDLKVVLGNSSEVTSNKGMAIGLPTTTGRKTSANGTSSIAIGIGAQTASSAASSIAFGANATANAIGAVQIGDGANSVANSLKFRNYMIVDPNGKVYSSALPDSLTNDVAKAVISASNAIERIAEANRPYTMIYDPSSGRALTADGRLVNYGKAPKIAGNFTVSRNMDESYSELPNGFFPTLAYVNSDQLVDGVDWSSTVTPSVSDGNGGFYNSTAQVSWSNTEYGNSILPLSATIEKVVSSFGTQTTLYLNSYGYTYYTIYVPDLGEGELSVYDTSIDGNKVTMNWSFYDYEYWNYYSGTDVFELNFNDVGGDGVQAVAFGDRGHFATMDEIGEIVSDEVERRMNDVDSVRSRKMLRTGRPMEYGDGWGYIRYDFTTDNRWWEIKVPNITANITASTYPYNSSTIQKPYVADRVFLRSSGTNGTDRCLSSVWDIVFRFTNLDVVVGSITVTNGIGITSLTTKVPSGQFYGTSSNYNAYDLSVSSVSAMPSSTVTINLSYKYHNYSSTVYNGTAQIRLTATSNSYTLETPDYYRNIGGENHHMFWDDAMKCTWNVAVSNGSFFAEIVSTTNLLWGTK